MIEAFLHGKLSCEQQNMEDLLTSCVFGLLGYVPASEGLFPFLRKARTLTGKFPLQPLLSNNASVRTREYWPWWTRHRDDQEGCEPDVVLTLDGHVPAMVLVEAKYRSGKSSEEDEDTEKVEDQLAREWIQLASRCGNRFPFLVYLTADVVMPMESIEESLHVLQGTYKHKGTPEPMIGWLSWREIPGLFNLSSNPLLRDLVLLAKRLDLDFFSGFPCLEPGILNAWRIQIKFNFPDICSMSDLWEYSNERKG